MWSRFWIAIGSPFGRGRLPWCERRTSCSIWATISSASSARPWVRSQRGLSGIDLRIARIAVARIAPRKKPKRQLIASRMWFRSS